MKEADLTNTKNYSDNLPDNINELKQSRKMVGVKTFAFWQPDSHQHSLMKHNLIDGLLAMLTLLFLEPRHTIFVTLKAK